MKGSRVDALARELQTETAAPYPLCLRALRSAGGDRAEATALLRRRATCPHCLIGIIPTDTSCPRCQAELPKPQPDGVTASAAEDDGRPAPPSSPEQLMATSQAPRRVCLRALKESNGDVEAASDLLARGTKCPRCHVLGLPSDRWCSDCNAELPGRTSASAAAPKRKKATPAPISDHSRECGGESAASPVTRPGTPAYVVLRQHTDFAHFAQLRRRILSQLACLAVLGASIMALVVLGPSRMDALWPCWIAAGCLALGATIPFARNHRAAGKLAESLLAAYASEVYPAAGAHEASVPHSELYESYLDWLGNSGVRWLAPDHREWDRLGRDRWPDNRPGRWLAVSRARFLRHLADQAARAGVPEHADRALASRRREWIVASYTAAVAALVSPIESLPLRGCATIGVWLAASRIYRAGDSGLWPGRGEYSPPEKPAHGAASRRLSLLHDVVFFCVLYFTVVFIIDAWFISRASDDWVAVLGACVMMVIVCPRRFRAPVYAVLLGYTVVLFGMVIMGHPGWEDWRAFGWSLLFLLILSAGDYAHMRNQTVRMIPIAMIFLLVPLYLLFGFASELNNRQQDSYGADMLSANRTEVLQDIVREGSVVHYWGGDEPQECCYQDPVGGSERRWLTVPRGSLLQVVSASDEQLAPLVKFAGFASWADMAKDGTWAPIRYPDKTLGLMKMEGLRGEDRRGRPAHSMSFTMAKPGGREEIWLYASTKYENAICVNGKKMALFPADTQEGAYAKGQLLGVDLQTGTAEISLEGTDIDRATVSVDLIRGAPWELSRTQLVEVESKAALRIAGNMLILLFNAFLMLSVVIGGLRWLSSVPVTPVQWTGQYVEHLFEFWANLLRR